MEVHIACILWTQSQNTLEYITVHPNDSTGIEDAIPNERTAAAGAILRARGGRH
jgi:hypothetical protein